MQSSVWSLLMLAAVVASIPVALWTLKRLQLIKGGSQKQLNVMCQLSVGARERIAIIQVHDRQILIGITPQQINLLIEIEPDAKTLTETDEVPNSASRGLAFAQALANTRAGLRNDS